ncbi:MAG: hypothetical protein MZW92_19885 [Comamonadaceae bacterium]|nr:hypothetical protein [Comamonadaceae bacterium]
MGLADQAAGALHRGHAAVGAMEGAGKLIDDDELRAAMAGKGLGTPATRAAIIEGLIDREVHAARRPASCIPTRQGLPAA